jgi:hypothetical protein
MTEASPVPAFLAATFPVPCDIPAKQRDARDVAIMELPMDTIMIMLLHRGAAQQAA